MNHDEIYGKNYKDKKTNRCHMLKTTSYLLLLVRLDILKLCKKLLDLP